jgi:hypothetical protein
MAYTSCQNISPLSDHICCSSTETEFFVNEISTQIRLLNALFCSRYLYVFLNIIFLGLPYFQPSNRALMHCRILDV